MENKFPRFWFEANLYFGWINSEEELNKVFEIYNGTMTRDELLDKCKNSKVPDKEHKYDNFGLYSEHIHGDTTLRQFLEENGVILHKEFIPVLFQYHSHAEIQNDKDPNSIVYTEANVVKLLKIAIDHAVKVGYYMGVNATEEDKINFFVDKKKLVETATEGFIATYGQEYFKLMKEYDESTKK